MKLNFKRLMLLFFSCIALNANAITGEKITLSFELAEMTPVSSLAVAAQSDVRLADRVDIQAPMSVVNGDLFVNNDAKVMDIFVGGNVQLGHRSTVQGSILSGGTVRTESSTTISGSVREQEGSEPSVSIEWSVNVPTINNGDINLEPDHTQAIEPGRYAQLAVKSRSTLILSSGVYLFDRVMIEPQAKLQIDDENGPVQILVKNDFTFRGEIKTGVNDNVQLLIAVLGDRDALIEAPFNGVIIASEAKVRVQAARPQGHRAVIFGKELQFEPDTIIRRLPFDWVSLNPGFGPKPGDNPPHIMTEGDLDLTISIPAEGPSTTTSTGSTDTPTTFTLPTEYTIDGGIIGNGGITFRFRLPGGDWHECRYRGLSNSAAPVSPEQLIRGSVVALQNCSDGLAANTRRTASEFELRVEGIPGYPSVVQAPMQREDVCNDNMEILNPIETWEMRNNFSWADATPVAGNNADGTPTLYYAWVHIANKVDALNLKKLFIHVLNRPLFDEELMAYAGRCGTFTNPGDGYGQFVPVLIPGITYNRLVDALTSDEVSGDRVIFDAVILRDLPVGVRNSNGSVNIQALGESGFRYLDYEADPFRPSDEIVLEGGGVSKALTDTLAWVGQAARDVGEAVTGVINEIDQLFRGEVEVDIFVHAITQDSLFSHDIMRRGWGQFAGEPLGASGMQVKILQRAFDTFIPSTAKDDTNIVGHASIDATDGAQTRGSGLCIELRTRAALVTGFLIADEICDLRGFDANSGAATVGDFRLDRLTSDRNLSLHIDNTRLMGLYQSDDVFRYSQHVMNYTPKRARILTGHWANTFTSRNEDGVARLFAPCLNFPNSFSDAVLAASAGAGALAGAGLGSVIPGVGTAVGAAVASTAAAVFSSVVTNSDIVMSTQSRLRESRGVMSHEYGHYMFCNMLYDANSQAVDHVIWGTMIAGDTLNLPLRYTNEAMADYFEGQVVSGVDYGWLQESETGTGDEYCSDRQIPCWDVNLSDAASDSRDLEFGNLNIGRVATLIMDVFDGQNQVRTANVATDGDAWRWDAGVMGLVLNTNSDGDSDQDRERVALNASNIREISAYLAFGMEPFFQYNISDARFEEAGFAIDDAKIRAAVHNTMLDQGVNWCGRCGVLALHEPGANIANVQEVWRSCENNADLAGLLGASPDPGVLRMDASSCQVCPDGFISDANGQCVACANDIVGNTCVTCQPDVILDGSTMSLSQHVFDLTTSAPGDICPAEFIVEVQNTGALFARDQITGISTGLDPLPLNHANCERQFSLAVTQLPIAGAVNESLLQGFGSFAQSSCGVGEICLISCNNLPRMNISETEFSDGRLRYQSPAMPNAQIKLTPTRPPVVVR